MKPFVQALVAATALVAASVAPAFADNVVLTLTRTNLTNVTDAAGLWQYESGTVARGSTAAGQYAIERRVTTGGTEAQNTAAERVTLFLAAARDGAPEDIVLLGAHSFTTGAFNGSVAAASSRYAYMRGGDVVAPAAGSTYNITISWLGLAPFALP